MRSYCLLCAQDGTFSPCINHPKKGKMPAFPGLTREEEEDFEEHTKDQLLGLLEHKREFRFFSPEFIETINPKFKPKREKDPEWLPGMETQTKRRKLGGAAIQPQRAPPTAPPSPRPSSLPSSPAAEESTDLGDFASYFQGK